MKQLTQQHFRGQILLPWQHCSDHLLSTVEDPDIMVWGNATQSYYTAKVEKILSSLSPKKKKKKLFP
jgi:hypothetical protein